jgi:hypothetical protein
MTPFATTGIRSAIAVLVISTIVSACGQDDVQVGVPKPQTPFFPLSIGSEWTYQESFTVEFVSLGGGVVPPPRRLEATSTRRLTGVERRLDRTYVVEHEVMFSDSVTDTTHTWIRYRQDESGLYSADVPGNQPPDSSSASAALGIDGDNESTVLAYPLRVGAEWVVRRTPMISAVVEARDTLRLDAGTFDCYRIRVSSETSGPEDVMLRWFGSCGRLRTLTHTEVFAVDVGTGDTTLVITEEIAELRAFALEGASRCPSSGGP